VVDALAVAQSPENPFLFFQQIGRNNDGDRLADGLFARETKEALRTPAFQVRMTPLRSFEMMASSEDSTRAASQGAASWFVSFMTALPRGL
jgi:hypothetical protein